MLDPLLGHISATSASLLFGAVGFLVGSFVTHKWARSRDQAKEYNGLADAVRNQLRRELGDIRHGVKCADTDSLNTLIDMSSPFAKAGLRRAVEDYKTARQQCTEQDSCGQVHYAQTDHIKQAITRLIEKLPRR